MTWLEYNLKSGLQFVIGLGFFPHAQQCLVSYVWVVFDDQFATSGFYIWLMAPLYYFCNIYKPQSHIYFWYSLLYDCVYYFFFFWILFVLIICSWDLLQAQNNFQECFWSPFAQVITISHWKGKQLLGELNWERRSDDLYLKFCTCKLDYQACKGKISYGSNSTFKCKCSWTIKMKTHFNV